MQIPDLPPDIAFRPLKPTDEEFSYQVKAQGLGPHIKHRWGWDEQFQRNVHRQRLQEKPFSKIELGGGPIGTLSLQLHRDYVRFGEFYLMDAFHGFGIGSRILGHCLGLADDMELPVRLEYLLWNPVGSLYRRNGFIEIGRTPTHYLMERPARLSDA